MSQIIFEPFRIKVVEPIRISSSAERRIWIEEAGYNVFNLRAEQVMIDLLTDSGTSAMSQEQWACIMSGDETYAGSKSFYELERVAQDIFRKKVIIPVHQGRAAEHLVFSRLVKPGDTIPSNGHFDTTSANIIDNGGVPLNFPIAASKDLRNTHPFKGNMDVAALKQFLESEEANIPFVMLSITNNTVGGQPASLENIEETAALCRQHGKMFIIDACRFAENAYFIKKREKAYSARTPLEIAQTIFALCDILTFSGKKDALANIGGLVCLNDASLAENLTNRLIVTEGFATYGGLAGRDLAAMAQGLREVLDETYLSYRLRTIEWMVERLDRAEVPVLLPAGGHGLYLDAAKFSPQIPPQQFPGIALVVELYIRGGIRVVEVGNVCFGSRDEKGKNVFPPLDLVRLAMPRRVYTEAHAGYVVETIIEAYKEREHLSGFVFARETPVMRHFRSTFRPA